MEDLQSEANRTKPNLSNYIICYSKDNMSYVYSIDLVTSMSLPDISCLYFRYNLKNTSNMITIWLNIRYMMFYWSYITYMIY